ncbi:MAG TPA: OmpA family protein, partial [Cyclobacteriaceae bacterium]|nr:OmpA family protein [Cyclobacteriaceae bacterium]
KDSYGDRDLYVSFQKKDTLWSEPLNLGPVVNSAGLESAPFLDADNKTLYYSSNGFSGYGGSDIYMTIRLDDTWTNWTEPLNLGPDINSPLEDLFFNIPKESSYAYYSRGITDEDLDIFRVKLPIYKVPEILVAVKGVIRDAKTGEPLRAEVIYERLSDGKRIGVVKPNPLTGEFDFQLPTGEIYGVRADLDGYIAESQNIDLRSHKEGTTYKPTNLSLVPIEEDVVIVLNNVFFLFDKAELTKESFPELDRIAELLVDKSSINIEIAGHTCDMGPSEYNLSLSERRAKAVFNYLTSKGVNSSRIGVVFFGEDKPIVPNTSIDNRKKNRRVEFKILGK